MAKETTDTTALPIIPTEWPGAFGLYKHSKKAILTNWQVLVGLIALSFGVGILLGTIQLPFNTFLPKDSLGSTGSSIIFEFLSNIASLLIAAFTMFVIVASVKGKKVSLGETFSGTLPYLLNLFIAMILMYLVAFVTFIALIVPFFIFAPRVLLTLYYVIDKDMGPVEALQASWNDTKGNVGKIYGIIGANIVFILPMFTILLIPLSLYWLFMYQAAVAILYFHIAKKPEVKV